MATKLFHDALLYIFPKDCFEQLVLQGNVFHKECAPMVLSRALGLAITIGSLMLFLPQIIKIARARSAEGISLTSQLLALVGAAGTAAYSYTKGFVFTQWGDSLFVSIQIVIIIMQILHFSGQTAWAFAFMATSWLGIIAVSYHYVPLDVLTTIQTLSIPIVLISKTMQAWANYKAQSTGQLSLISVALQFGGTLARTFTSVQETGDQLLIIGFASAAAMNGLIFAQFFMYWGAEERRKKLR